MAFTQSSIDSVKVADKQLVRNYEQNTNHVTVSGDIINNGADQQSPAASSLRRLRCVRCATRLLEDQQPCCVATRRWFIIILAFMRLGHRHHILYHSADLHFALVNLSNLHKPLVQLPID